MTTSETIVKCHDVMKIYPSNVEGLNFPALRGLNLEVKAGELISIIGPSGAGKTTLLRLLSGFDTPTSGSIRVNGNLLNNLSNKQLVKHRQDIVGIMYQSPQDNLIWNFSALDNVMIPLRYSGKYPNNQKQRALELLDKVNLKGKEHRKIAQLSGGEQQRVALATALSNNPKLLLADEPTGELDSHTADVIIDYFKELNNETGLSIIVVTHDKRFSNAVKTTYRIQDGRITDFHVPKSWKKIEEREEAVIVDSQGNLRLPKEVLQQFDALHSVKVKVTEGQIVLTPFKRGDI